MADTTLITYLKSLFKTTEVIPSENTLLVQVITTMDVKDVIKKVIDVNEASDRIIFLQMSAHSRGTSIWLGFKREK